MRKQLERVRYAVMSCLAALIFVLGCGSRNGTLDGTVLYRGAPVPNGTLSLFIQGKVFETEIQDGRFQLRGLPHGEARVTVVRLDPNQPNPHATLLDARKQSAENKGTRTDAAVISDPIRLDRLERNRHLLPYVYASLDTTDLRCTVSPGANTVQFSLVDRSVPH